MNSSEREEMLSILRRKTKVATLKHYYNKVKQLEDAGYEKNKDKIIKLNDKIAELEECLLNEI